MRERRFCKKDMRIQEFIEYSIKPIFLDSRISRKPEKKAKITVPNHTGFLGYTQNGYYYYKQEKALIKTKEFRLKFFLLLSLACNIAFLAVRRANNEFQWIKRNANLSNKFTYWMESKEYRKRARAS